MNIVIQLIGLIAMVAWVSSIQLNKKDKILELQIIASLFYAVHYGLLDAMSAVGVTIVSIIRLTTIYIIEKKGKTVPVYVLLIFMAMLVGVGVITYTGPISVLPIIITMIYTYCTWQKNTKVIRIGFFCAGWMWILYNFTVGAYVLMIGNALEVISSTVSFFRFDKNKKDVDDKNNTKDNWGSDKK